MELQTTLKEWISVDETQAFNSQCGFAQAGLAPELLHPASLSLHKPNPRTGIWVCQAGRAVLAIQGGRPLCLIPQGSLGSPSLSVHPL